MATQHPDYSILASRIAVSNLHKNTTKVFSEVAKELHDYIHPKVCVFKCGWVPTRKKRKKKKGKDKRRGNEFAEFYY